MRASRSRAKSLTNADSEFLLYQTEDGRTRVEVRFDGDNAWLTQAALAELFQTTPQNITQHIAAIYKDGELAEAATCKPYLQVRQEGQRQVERDLKHYNLQMILAVGYRVRSHRGTQFRQWATAHLGEFLVKGFTMDDERLKHANNGSYFDELLEGQTAAEVIAACADASKPNMGLTNWAGEVPRKADVAVAKSYLHGEEVAALNRIVNVYLEFAELQAMQRRPMYMADWIRKLDEFVRLTEREILDHAGEVTREAALAKAELEYDRFAKARAAQPSPVEAHFHEAVATMKQIEGKRPRRNQGSRKP